jgi:hypothetical protein
MKQKRIKIPVLLAISISLALVTLFMAGVQSANAGDLLLDGTPSPAVTPTPDPSSGGDTAGGGSSTVRTTVTNIFYHLRFPAETISAASGNNHAGTLCSSFVRKDVIKTKCGVCTIKNPGKNNARGRGIIAKVERKEGWACDYLFGGPYIFL